MNSLKNWSPEGMVQKNILQQFHSNIEVFFSMKNILFKYNLHMFHIYDYEFFPADFGDFIQNQLR